MTQEESLELTRRAIARSAREVALIAADAVKELDTSALQRLQERAGQLAECAKYAIVDVQGREAFERLRRLMESPELSGRRGSILGRLEEAFDARYQAGVVSGKIDRAKLSLSKRWGR